MDYAAAFATLAQSWAAYQSRPEQIQLTEKIAQTLQNQGILLVEAGTGIGKTLSYLLPCLLEQRRVIIATANKNLQEQIFTKDIPALKRALSCDLEAVLLKGRRSYFCYFRHQAYRQSQDLWRSEEESHFAAVDDFLRHSADGDLAALHGIPETAPIMEHLSCSSEDCLRASCPFFERCFVYRAREKAASAALIVMNHHLLGVLAKMAQLGLPTLLQERDAFIIDEAHQLEEALRDAFGAACSLRRLLLYFNFCQNQAIYLKNSHYIQILQNQIDALRQLEYDNDLKQEALLTEQTLWQPLRSIYDLLSVWLREEQQSEDEPQDEKKDLERQRARQVWLQRTQALADDLAVLLHVAHHPEQQEEALWLETQKNGFNLCTMPADVGAGSASLWTQQASIFLSATLTPHGHPDYFARTLGLEDYDFIRFDSPFDYRRQALFYYVRGLPEPKHQDYVPRAMEALQPVLECSRGRALLLFTSHRALQQAANFWKKQRRFKVLVQGEDSKNQLLHRFRHTPEALLLATQSFWEGVDISGKDLVCVFIERLPFPVPDEPVRLLRQKRLGSAYFRQEYLPQMLMQLKQGAGRLIRSAQDYGVLMLCDPRLNHPRYGAEVLAALPRMTRSDDLAVVKRFFLYHEGESR